MKAAALFDLDGVIVDTEPQYTEFWRAVGDDYFPDNRDFALEIKGHTLTYILATYFPGDEGGQEAIVKRLNAHQQTMSYPYIRGVMNFVQELRKRGIGTAVVTSSDQVKMGHLYSEHPEFMAYFDRVFTAEDALRSKPAPDCYIAAARHFGLSPQQCVVFEDSFNGLQSGRDSGAKVVGVATSNSRMAIAPYCDVVVDDFAKPEALIELFGK